MRHIADLPQEAPRHGDEQGRTQIYAAPRAAPTSHHGTAAADQDIA
jgi:hypothetical protein